jgi:hypothetical protein
MWMRWTGSKNWSPAVMYDSRPTHGSAWTNATHPKPTSAPRFGPATKADYQAAKDNYRVSGGCDLDGDPMTVIVAIEADAVIITIF